MASTHDYDVDKRNNEIKVYVDGKLYKRKEAKVSVMDSGYLLGDGVWEGIRLHKKKLIHLDEHIDRLYNGANAISMDIGMKPEKLKSEIYNVISENKMDTDVHIRLIISRGIKSTPYQHPKVTIGEPTIVIIPEYKKASIHVIKNGITLGLVKTIRDKRVQDPTINSLSKHNCISACIEADKLGVDEGLMLDPHGFVSTCNSTNFFILKENEVWTSTGEYCLNGITRGTIIRLCKEYKVPILEKNFLIQDVYNANEIFVTGTFSGIIPVVSIDGFKVGDGTRGSFTKLMQKRYQHDLEKIILS
ncbi:MAG: aminotransferase class IV [Fidelibacterota bacterium]|jgi:branched-chain amino acid aminotransferase|tara:strand:- start:1565 stop:2473 length:909 start_codon:yes stop_codon:yes gene_type:complete